MSSSIFRWSVPFVITAFTLTGSAAALPTTPVNPIRLGVAYFEPPRSVGTPLEDLARLYTGFGLAAKIEGRLRLDTDASLDSATRELIRRRLAQES
ncbi:MAG TPA: hypothetical protein VFX42_11230 [Gemmatimonadales bacterium]|nr:hypothetical protein [Gemmatimonadales bacterium]